MTTDLLTITDDELARRVEEANGRISSLRNELRATEQSFAALSAEAAMRASGMRPGDVVRYSYGQSTRRGKVVEIHRPRWSGGQPILDVRTITASGALGATVRLDYQRWKKETP